MFSMLPSKDGIFVHIIVFMYYFQKQAQIKKLEGENKNLKGVLRDGARELNDKRGVSDNCQACRGMLNTYTQDAHVDAVECNLL